MCVVESLVCVFASTVHGTKKGRNPILLVSCWCYMTFDVFDSRVILNISKLYNNDICCVAFIFKTCLNNSKLYNNRTNIIIITCSYNNY